MSDQGHDYEIIRHKQDGYATLGRMYDASGLIVCVTLERPFVDANNDGARDPNVSRFQHGLWRCFLRKSHKNGGDGKRDHDVWQFESVPDIVAAQMHRATWPWHLEGCVGLGSGFGDVLFDGPTVRDGTHPRESGKRYSGITGSKNAFEKFMKDSLSLCAREGRDPAHIWVRVTDRFDAPAGSFA